MSWLAKLDTVRASIGRHQRLYRALDFPPCLLRLAVLQLKPHLNQALAIFAMKYLSSRGVLEFGQCFELNFGFAGCHLDRTDLFEKERHVWKENHIEASRVLHDSSNDFAVPKHIDCSGN